MKLFNLNYKKGAIRLAAVLTILFAVFGYQSRSDSPWSWMWGTVSGTDAAGLAMKEAATDKCSKASIIDVQFDQKVENEKLWNQSTLVLILNKDPANPKLLGDDAAKDCHWIAELSHFITLPDTGKDYLHVSDITKDMYDKAESVMKRRYYWEFIKDRAIGVFDYV